MVWGLLANSPFGGMTWQALHHIVPLRKLGFDVWYVEDSDSLVRAPGDGNPTMDIAPNARWLAQWMDAIGLGDRWILRAPGREETYGDSMERLIRLYAEADVVLNVCGARETAPHAMVERHQAIRCLALIETDPGADQIRIARGDVEREQELGAHDFLFTYGENIGADDCLVPAGAFAWHPTRPPVHMPWWNDGLAPVGSAFTTVGNWHHSAKDVVWQGRPYRWSKDVAFRPYIDVPARSPIPLELALGAISSEERESLRSRGWRMRDTLSLQDPLAYRDYILSSGGEFTAAKEQVVGLRTGWFSDRSACYLAAGRPVITEATGFEKVLPTGEGLFAFNTADEAVAALEEVASDPHRHAAAAQEVAHEYFAAERVLGSVLRTMGLL